MIFILSDTLDQSTNDLVDWANYYKKNPFVVTDEDKISVLDIDVNNLKFKVLINNTVIDSTSIEYFIYRKGDLNLTHPLLEDNDIKESLQQYFNEELEIIKHYIIYILQKVTKKYIGDYFYKIPNKLFYLDVARSCGLNIPDTVITSQKVTLKQLYKKNNRQIITKAISESYGEVSNNKLSYSYTSAVKSDMISSAPKVFFPSLFQNHVAKIAELRVFFVENIFFPMAMFYDNDETDYRDNYDKIKRMTPFVLPNNLEKKLNKFRKKIGLTTGSIDLMMGDVNNQYFFLEVNPNGQFGFVSDACNYNIEKKIIELLIENS